MTRKSTEPEGTVVFTDHQKNGKGQRGSIWIAELGKNVLMSVLLRPKFLLPQDQFHLNIIVGLAIVDTLGRYSSSKILLKWPNDVYLNGKKIAGVLIENNLRGSSLETAVIGIGLNVNQSSFPIPSATSLFIETEQLCENDAVMEYLLVYLEKWYLKLKNGNKRQVLDEYLKRLMWRGELHEFRSGDGKFEGEIVGIDDCGKLCVNINGTLKSFSIKEVEFVA